MSTAEALDGSIGARSSSRELATPRRRASRPASRPNASCCVHMLRQVRPDIPVLFLDTVHHFAQTLRYRDEMAARGSSTWSTCGRRAGARAVADESTEACCARHKVGPLFGALERLRHLVHRPAARSVALAREPAGSRAVHACRPARSLRKVSPLAHVDAPRTSGATRRTTTSRCCRSTSSATPASAASRARRCRSTSNERSGRWQGRSSSAGSISRRRRRCRRRTRIALARGRFASATRRSASQGPWHPICRTQHNQFAAEEC